MVLLESIATGKGKLLLCDAFFPSCVEEAVGIPTIVHLLVKLISIVVTFTSRFLTPTHVDSRDNDGIGCESKSAAKSNQGSEEVDESGIESPHCIIIASIKSCIL